MSRPMQETVAVDVFVVDDQPPEAVAMLQALYSRSAKSARSHLEQVRRQGSSKFMASYYVGYGHASIGDCGVTTIFIENVSILAAKAIQDNPLYSGQETSTRYIDFARQGYVSPLQSELACSIIRDALDFYVTSQEPVLSYLKELHRPSMNQSENVFLKSLHARKFDILRAFLPAGVRTQLSWTSSLRQAAENIARLSSHPLKEVRDIADRIKLVLTQRYASSFSHKMQSDIASYLEEQSLNFHYPTYDLKAVQCFTSSRIHFDVERLTKFASALISRPKYAPLPREFGRIARYRFQFLLDYGSYRDLHRHRNGYCPNPILTTELGFEDWYIGQLPSPLKERAKSLLCNIEARIAELSRSASLNAAELQYYIPMGYKVACDLEYDLTQAIYVSELRSGRTVHPTLRKVANEMAKVVQETVGSIAIYNDSSEDILSAKRGEQDIVAKEEYAI